MLSDRKGPDNDRPGLGLKEALAKDKDKPHVLPVIAKGIPAVLRQLRQWVCWVLLFREGKWTKVPINPRTGVMVDYTKSANWSSFKEALNFYEKHRGENDLHSDRDKVSGVAFVFKKGVVGIDLDDCRNPDTGELTPWAKADVKQLGTYGEASPTATGVKLLAFGSKPGGNCSKGNVEIYDHARFFTITGHHLGGTPDRVRRRSGAIARLYEEVWPPQAGGPEVNGEAAHAPPHDLTDEQILEKARAARNSAKFTALWEGDTSEYDGDDSAADLALCGHLAFWCGPDHERIDRLFRQSGLMREKWDARRGASTYGSRTISTALKGRTDFYKPKNAEALGETGASPYGNAGGRIIRFDREGNVIPLCNFDANIVGETVLDDGAERRTFLELEGKLAAGRPLPRIEVLASDFAAMGWVLSSWGNKAIVYAGQGVKDHLRTAIQVLSSDAPSRTVYGHLGWREIGSQCVYLHAGGAIGENGPVAEVEVQVPDALAGYALPEPVAGEELAKAVEASLRILDLAADRITAPVLAAVFRSVLAPTDFALHLAGATGAGKTELATLAQQHFGQKLDSRHLPGSWSSTANSLEGLAFAAKDALLVVDDFAPNGSVYDVNRYHKEADRLIRAQGNRAGRGRCRTDGSVRPARPPRGLILSSGEDIPRGQSVRGRMLILELSLGDMDWGKLTEAQADAAAGRFALVLASYVRWLVPRIAEVRRKLAFEAASLRDELHTKGEHARTPGLIADLLLGVRYFLKFALESGAITAERQQQLSERFRVACLAAAAEQAAHVQAADPAVFFLRLLAAVFTSGRAHLAVRRADGSDEGVADDQAPLERVGWLNGSPSGHRIGWVEGENLYLEPEAAFAVVQDLAREQGDAIAVQSRTLWRRLREKNLLASYDQKRGHNTVRIRVEQARYNVLHLHASSLYSAKHRPHRPHRPQEAKNPEKTGGRVGPITEKDPDYRPRASAPGCERTVKTKAQTTNKPAAEEGVGPIGGADSRTKNKHRPRPAAKKGPKTSQKQQGGADGADGADVLHNKEGQGSGVTYFT
jgi:hypothetical protein